MLHGPEHVHDPDVLTQTTTISAAERAIAALSQHAPDVLRELLRESQQRGGRDLLTGAWERAAGLDQLRRAVDRAHRTQEPLVVIFADVDYLKAINDTQGHAAGDAALRAIGAALRSTLRSYDLTVRLGGDELLAALPHAGLQQAENRMVAVATLLQAATPPVSLSCGYATLQIGQSADDVIAAADADMYSRRREVRAAEGLHIVPQQPPPV